MANNSSGPVRVAWQIDTGFASAQHNGTWEIDRSQWDALEPGERRKMLREMMQDEISDHIDGSYSIENGEIGDDE